MINCRNYKLLKLNCCLLIKLMCKRYCFQRFKKKKIFFIFKFDTILENKLLCKMHIWQLQTFYQDCGIS